MNRIKVLEVIIVIVSATSLWADSHVVYFADENLELAVENALGIDDPNENDMLILTELDAQYREITDLTGIGYAVNLIHLHLYSNQLTSLPPEIGNLTKLILLDLGTNRLTSLPPEIGNLNKLTYLGLYINQFTSLPPEIGSLTELTSLSSSYNYLTSLPPEIGNLNKLTSLSLSYNYLTSLPPEIGNLANLTELYLYGNPLDSKFYCNILPVILDNNPTIDIHYDHNPNPITDNCSTNHSELSIFASHWLETNCNSNNNWCGGADLNHVDDVNFDDFAEFASYWLN